MLFFVLASITLLVICVVLALPPALLKSLYIHIHGHQHAQRPHPPEGRRPSIGSTETKITQDIAPYQFPPLRVKSSSRMAMGLKRLDTSNWLTLDTCYLHEHTLRLTLLATRHADTVRCLPGSLSACHEVLSLVSSFMASRFPQHFALVPKTQYGGPYIENHLTGEVFLIGEKCPNPLETAAKLAMEDFSVLAKDETGEYCLKASATLFPAGWKLQDRIGFSMAELHGPVPGWQEKLGGSVSRYFDHLSPKTSMERTNLFIQTTSNLFQDAPESPLSPHQTLSYKHLRVRRERQTFTRLPESDTICFTVRTYMQELDDLDDEQIRALRSQVSGWEEDMKAYKGYAIWGECLMEWCEERVGPMLIDDDSEEAHVKENGSMGNMEKAGGGCMWMRE